MYGFVIVLLFFFFMLLNLGKWIDVTAEPVKSDIVICLGGGTIERVKKSIELLEEGYAQKHIFLLLGESGYNQPYIKKNYPDLSVEIEESPKNTKEEVLFIHKYMKMHNYESALIVTDPPHSGRVKLLTSILSVKEEEAMTFFLVGSDVKWWDAAKYYKNERARNFAWHESIRILYRFIFN